MIDPTITIGNIIEISTIAIGGVTFLVKVLEKFTLMTNNMDVFSRRLDKVDMQMEKVEQAMARLSDVTAQLAVHNNRVDALEVRLGALSTRIEQIHTFIFESGKLVHTTPRPRKKSVAKE